MTAKKPTKDEPKTRERRALGGSIVRVSARPGALFGQLRRNGKRVQKLLVSAEEAATVEDPKQLAEKRLAAWSLEVETADPSDGITCSAPTNCARRSTKRSAIASSTSTRSIDAQSCPALWMPQWPTPATVRSRLQSASTIAASLPPSSSERGISASPACAAARSFRSNTMSMKR